MAADIGACKIKHKLATTLFFFANNKNDKEVVDKGLNFLCV